MEMIAVDLAGKVAATGLRVFNDLLKGQSDMSQRSTSTTAISR